MNSRDKVRAPAPLREGEVDTDTGSTFVLKGRLVTMNDANAVIDAGRLAIRQGRLEAVLRPGEPLPPGFESAPVIDTRATLYPGLIDLHNHFAYNILPLWRVPAAYHNRDQWPRHAEYKSSISLPLHALAAVPETARAIVRYVEAKALLAGTTTGQGIKTQVAGGIRLFRGAMRNVEQTDDARLPEANTLVPDLRPVPEDIAAFRRSLTRYPAFFYHLSEGTDASARQHFVDLQANALLAPSLVGVHALALQPEDYVALARAGAKAVWSPFSNLLLYGRTLDLNAVLDAGVPLSLGCDWSPTGSKNLLEELKVARWVSAAQGGRLDEQRLVSLVTREPAACLGWSAELGTLRAGALADVVAIAGTTGDPYSLLVDATEAEVQLVVVHGVPRCGAENLMRSLWASPGAPLEILPVAGAPKAFALETPGSELAGLKLTQASATLEAALSDLPGFIQTRHRAGAKDAHERPFVLALDMEQDLEHGDMAALVPELLADATGIAPSVPLDALAVDATHLERVGQQHNLPPALQDVLTRAYA
ncbi:amidohydrolase family protein [Myxococcaceae bacterium JPH2]|nr:amidohydrolase family protein [Myxococcaceae bacterium JPH2]